MDFIIQEFSKLDTTCVSDACDKLGIRTVMEGIKPVFHGNKICGKAFTVKYEACGSVKGTVGDFLDDVKPGEIVAIDNGGRTNGTVWGDIMSIVANKNNVGGTVIDGVCRDLPKIRELKYPIFSKGYNVVTGKDRYEVTQVNGSITIDKIRVNQGDIILGDDTGVLCIPSERAEEVLAIAKKIDEIEGEIEKAVLSGMSLKEAREKTGYHHLQTKGEKIQ